MKRLKRIISSVFIMFFAFSTTAFAATNTYTQAQLDLVTQNLADAHVDSKYATAIINHISANPLSQDEADKLTSEINSLASKTESKNSINDYTMDELTDMYSEAKSVAASFGLRLSMNGKIPAKKNQVYKTEITIYDDNGSVVGTTTLKEIKSIKSGIDLDQLKTAVKNVVLKDTSNIGGDPNQGGSTGTATGTGNSGTNGNRVSLIAGNRNPVMSTSMKKTGTNNGNLLLAGSVLLALAGTTAVIARKRKMA